MHSSGLGSASPQGILKRVFSLNGVVHATSNKDDVRSTVGSCVRPLCHTRSWSTILIQYTPICPLVLTAAIRRLAIAYSQHVN